MSWEMIVDDNGIPVYYEVYHMLSYAEHVGNWKNIQALDRKSVV